ncbi:hypothetical protein A2483_02605 [Candidatus Peregrinibacteria bacterium RIFOXYC2_FULL_33_13]|nr:MAG: hypothetical protein UR27_C0027G0019 [Candidatus Peregrinibacteria bacterium GW2011_GWA2_33_10]KKP40143.1 MAG: hypothetical protein UR30_C0006G0048 [Candidatus Peregrinibacteria bacterium GW2011_GWC2_33_13]OGJ47764.1 MAG: hypothetical protein A2229_04950 [Candidatus Peregrinibacteria bacterium RIFOXYA2_FULL_33_7]OGJ53764.1 MAG: hypothetical protein A2483_02605 [Candidatus Peregrinibacteria bacterium RIFOXYC2_FULL_33_13]
MSLKYPNRILSTLAILPLSILTSNVEIEGSCKEFSFGIQELLAGTQENSGENAEFIIEGNKRILQVRGKDLNKSHSLAYSKFISKIAEEIQKDGNKLTIANFETKVSYENEEFVFMYKVDLNQAINDKEVHKLVDMRGTVWCDGDSKNKVLNINKNKIPNWQKKLAET